MHICTPSAWGYSTRRQGKPGFSRQKMRNEYNKGIKRINLQKTPLTYFSKWTDSKSPYHSTPSSCDNGCNRWPNLSRVTTKQRCFPVLFSPACSALSWACSSAELSQQLRWRSSGLLSTITLVFSFSWVTGLDISWLGGWIYLFENT